MKISDKPAYSPYLTFGHISLAQLLILSLQTLDESQPYRRHFRINLVGTAKFRVFRDLFGRRNQDLVRIGCRSGGFA